MFEKLINLFKNKVIPPASRSNYFYKDSTIYKYNKIGNNDQL